MAINLWSKCYVLKFSPCVYTLFVSLRRCIAAKRTFDRKADIPGSGRESVKVARRRGCVLLSIIRTSVDVIGYQVRRVVSGSLRATKNCCTAAGWEIWTSDTSVMLLSHALYPPRSTLDANFTHRTCLFLPLSASGELHFPYVRSTQGTTRIAPSIESVAFLASGGDQFFRSTLLDLFLWVG